MPKTKKTSGAFEYVNVNRFPVAAKVFRIPPLNTMAPLRALTMALLALEASCLGGPPSCSESTIYEGWPKVKWDELYVAGRPAPNYVGCTSIDIEGAELEAADVLQLCAAMASDASHLRQLTTLSFSGNPLSSEAHEAVAQLLRASDTLTSLSLGGVALDAESAAPLAAALRAHASLQRIELEWNQLEDEGATLVGVAVGGAGGVLRSLGLARNAIGDAGAVALGVLLRSSDVLTSLRLEGNALGPQGAASLADGLRHNAVLTHLGLELNPVGPQGAQRLSAALLTNTRLTDLAVSGAGLGDQGATTLAAGLRANSALRALRLERNGITDTGAAELAEMLRVNSGLQLLDLRENRMGAAAARAFATALLDNTVVLNPTRHYVMHYVMQYVKHYLMRCKVVLEIRLAGNYVLPGLGRVSDGELAISPELLAEIEALLGRNRELRHATLTPQGWSVCKVKASPC